MGFDDIDLDELDELSGHDDTYEILQACKKIIGNIRSQLDRIDTDIDNNLVYDFVGEISVMQQRINDINTIIKLTIEVEHVGNAVMGDAVISADDAKQIIDDLLNRYDCKSAAELFYNKIKDRIVPETDDDRTQEEVLEDLTALFND